MNVAAEIAELLHRHRRGIPGHVPGMGSDFVPHCLCGEPLPDHGPISGHGGRRIHRFDVHRSEVVATWLTTMYANQPTKGT